MASKQIRVGIIGAGGIANGAHIPGYLKCENVKIFAVCDAVEALAKATAEKYDVPHVFTDYRKLVELDELDVVSVCTPNYLHKDPAIRALKAGKHVLCEKPLAMNAREAQAMVDTAAQTGKKLQVGFHMRFSAEARALRKIIEAGTLGEIYYARSQALRRRGVPSWGVFGQKKLQGGGPLIDIGVHILDLTLHMMDFPTPVGVSGKTYTKFGNKPDIFGSWGPWDWKTFDVEDFAAAFVRFENGATLVLESSFCANIENDVLDFSLLGDKGGCRFSPLSVFTETNQTLLNITPSHLPRNVAAHAEEIAAFIDAVRKDKPVPVPGEQGLIVTKIIDAIYKSSDTGKEVKLL